MTKIVVIFMVFGLHTGLSQDSIYTRNIYFELGGSAGFGSFNYESDIVRNDIVNLSWSAGLTAFPIDKNNGIVFVIPTLLHCVIGGGDHKVEWAIGQGYSISTKGAMFSLLTPVVGYRYQRPHRHWFYRASYTPLVSYLFQMQYQNWFGLSVGYQW